MTDWRAWHDRYDDAESSLARRLTVVRAHVDAALRAAPAQRVLSLCAGDGRDLLPGLGGCEELAFDAEADGFGVGVARMTGDPEPVRALPERLFSFPSGDGAR